MALAVCESHPAGGITMKERTIGNLSLAAVLASYLILRYLLFDLHGMKEFPFMLCLAGVLLIVFTGIIRKNKVSPPLIALGYIGGFVAGVLFSYDYGEGLNNLWIIWMWCFVVASLFGMIGDLILKKRSKQK